MASTTTLVAAQVRAAVAEVEPGGWHLTILAAGEVDDADADEGGGEVGTVTPGVHPHGATDRARHPHGPLEAGEPGGDRAAGDDGQRGGPAGPDAGAVDLDLGEAIAQHDGQPGEAGVGHEEVGALADDQNGHARGDDGVAGGRQVVDRRRLEQQRGGTADPVGGARPERLVAPQPLAHGRLEQGRAGVERDAPA